MGIHRLQSKGFVLTPNINVSINSVSAYYILVADTLVCVFLASALLCYLQAFFLCLLTGI